MVFIVTKNTFYHKKAEKILNSFKKQGRIATNADGNPHDINSLAKVLEDKHQKAVFENFDFDEYITKYHD